MMPTRAPGSSMLVLTFHSISPGPGPTRIDAATFRMQMDVLAECGFASMTCREFIDWRGGHSDAAARVLITFDDGFADFATAAYPVLRERGFSCLVFVPTGKLGNREDWRGAGAARRPLLTWMDVTDLARAGVEFGGHGVTHADLTRLAPEQRRREIERCAEELEARLGHPTKSFAAPYGRVNRAVRSDLARKYEVAFGTRFDCSRRGDDAFDVPRIEMHYFRQRPRWHAFVNGERSYFRMRRTVRGLKTAATRLVDLRADRAGD